MSIETGAHIGMVAPDETTFDYLPAATSRRRARPGTPRRGALAALPSDAGARFDPEVTLDAGAIAPQVTWGTSPEHALPIDGTCPTPQPPPDAERRAPMERTGLHGPGRRHG